MHKNDKAMLEWHKGQLAAVRDVLRHGKDADHILAGVRLRHEDYVRLVELALEAVGEG